jgi:hypothetical protein
MAENVKIMAWKEEGIPRIAIVLWAHHCISKKASCLR